AEVVDQGVPVRVKALARIGMLVERRAVKVAQPVRIGREVSGHPVQYDAQAGAMAAVDKVGEIGGSAITGCGRELSQGLITPRSAERMLHNRHELQMRKPHLAGVIDQARADAVPDAT